MQKNSQNSFERVNISTSGQCCFLSNIQKNKAARTKKLSCLPSALSNTHISQNKVENLLESIDHFKSNKFGRRFSYHLLSA